MTTPRIRVKSDGRAWRCDKCNALVQAPRKRTIEETRATHAETCAAKGRR